MQCAFCQRGQLVLRRYQGAREIWACDQCGEETPLLDCPRCERRRVRRLPAQTAGTLPWACADCRVTQWACPQCQRGWVNSPQAQQCDRCR